MVNADVPIVRHQLAVAQSILDPCFKSLSQGGDARGYHGLGLFLLLTRRRSWKACRHWRHAQQLCAMVSDRGAPTGAATSTAARRPYAPSGQEAALASSRRLLERHLPCPPGASSSKFLRASPARPACLSSPLRTPPSRRRPRSRCMSGQTFVLDFHVEAGGKVAWAKLQRLLTSGDVVPSDAEAGNNSGAISMPHWLTPCRPLILSSSCATSSRRCILSKTPTRNTRKPVFMTPFTPLSSQCLAQSATRCSRVC